MKSHRSIAHLLSTLLLALFIAIPAPMFAQEGSVSPPVSSDVSNTNQEQSPAEPGTGEGEAPAAPSTGEGEAPAAPGTGEGEAPAAPGTGEGEAPAAPGTGEGEAPAAPGTGEGEAPAAPGTGEGEAPAAPGTGDPDSDSTGTEDPDSDSVSPETGEGEDAETGEDEGGMQILAASEACDFTEVSSGGWYNALVAAQADGRDVDCLDVPMPVVQGCTLPIPMTSYVVSSAVAYQLVWTPGNVVGQLRVDGSQPYHPTDNKLNPALRYNSGPVVANPGETITVTVFMVGPERDIAQAQFIGEQDASFTAWWGTGHAFTIECPAPEPIPVPELPAVPGVEACEVSSAGRAYRDKNIGNDVTERTFFGTGPIVNIDSWSDMTRLWGVADESLTNVTFTYTIKAGATFTASPTGFAYPGIGYPNVAGHPAVYPVKASGATVTSFSATQIVITVANMPAGSSWSVNAPIAWDGTEYYIDSTMSGTLTNCDVSVPEIPAPPVAEVCQQALSGRTVTSGPSADVIERTKFGEGGEVNADGWGTTFRLYGATDEPLTNVTATFTATQGFHFDGTYNTVSNPGGGALQGNGYTVKVQDITVTVTGDTVTVTIASMPAKSSWSVNVPVVVDIETGKLYMDSTMISTLTNCDVSVPEVPAPPVAEVCQQALSGRTVTYGPNASVDERTKFGEGGEVNADGWDTTFRLYGATDEPLTNVTATFTATQGFHFAGTSSELKTPGGGALQGNGYTVAADGITITVTESLVTVTVASMPANSSWSFNVPIVVDIQTGKLYMDSTMISDLADCAPVELALPTIVESVCDDQYRPTPASVTAPKNSESVTYSNVTASTSGNNITFKFTATANRGFTLEGVTLPSGYTLVDSASAAYSITLTLADCQVPPTVVTPQIPVLVPATCGEDDAGKVAEPTLQIPTTEGVTYSEVTVSPANSVKLSLTATANEGYTFVGATLPEGWTLVGSSEARYEIVADTLDCPTPEPTETPEPGTPEPGTPAPTEEPKAEDAPEVKGLPETGTGSNPASMIGLAAMAAGALAGVGLFFNNRKRS